MSVNHDDFDVKTSGALESQQSNGLKPTSGPHHDASRDFKHVEDIFDIETDPKWQTTKKELWSYYLYYVGNNGLAGFNYGPSQFQNLLYLAGYDQAQPPYSAPCEGDAVCVLPFMGKIRDVSSIVLITNGIAFAIQAVLFLIVGAWADYGSWRPNITIAFTIVAVAVSFAWLGVEDPAKWQAGVALYILGLITYQGALTFWTAAFPGLARSLPEMQESKRALDSGETTLAEHHTLDSLSRNRISNISFTISSAGEILLLAVMVGVLKGLHSDSSTEANTKAFSVLIALSGGFWLVCAIPWFALERRRPGARLPPGTSLLTIGAVQTWVALRECWKLKQTFLYLLFYFLMGDVLNTCVTVIGTLQNSLASYSTLQLTYLLIVGIAAQMVGIYQTMISEVVPRGKEFLFFAMFSVIGKTSAFIGPFVSSAIIDDSHNNNMPFAFLLGLGAFSFVLLLLVNVEKSRLECAEYLAAEARLEGMEQD
ncbi:hypothetical protein FRC09_002395 [Ceratobasidium sp. 395]|nr:hypothetical protein FRC09_002395 [Ceratobasidium sp. 395]